MRLYIETMGQKGEGLALHDGARLFVAGALPGETVEAEGGRTVSVIAASPDRVQPFCKHFGICGGCSAVVQHHLAAAAFSHGLRL